MPPIEGDRIGGRYRLVGRLGAGGMGVVFEARDERLGRNVAVKLLPPDRSGDGEARARLIREARSAAQLEHPGIVAVYDVGTLDDGGVFVVMERVSGRTLREAGPTATNRERLEWLSRLAEAIDAAHTEGVIHRDIKPDNVMVRDDGRVVLMDFGLARGAELATDHTVSPDEGAALTRSGSIVGTPAYLAPEQARGRPVPASDRWAFGVLAYELFVGARPFDATNAAHLLVQILDEDPLPVSGAGLPSACDAVFARALAKDPEQRFSRCTDFVRALSDALDGSAPRVAVTSPTPAEALPRSAVPSTIDSSTPRPVRFYAVIAAGLLITAGALGLAMWGDGDEAPASAAGEADLAIAPLAAPDTTLACAILDTEEPDQAWLGYAAASLTCRRAEWRLGYGLGRARPPAVLLDLPRVYDGSAPDEPWAEPGARARTLARAEESDAWIDGSVRHVGGRFEVQLELRATDELLAEGQGAGVALLAAVRQAMETLEGPDLLPLHPVPSGVQEAYGLRSSGAAALVTELEASMNEPCCIPPWRRALLEQLRDDGQAGIFGTQAAWILEPERASAEEPEEIDVSTPATLIRTMKLGLMPESPFPRLPPDLATRVGEYIEAVSGDPSRRVVEGELHLIAGFLATLRADPDWSVHASRARALLPFSRGAWQMDDSTQGLSTERARLLSWWLPGQGITWTMLGRASANIDERVRWTGRGHRLQPDSPSLASIYGDALLEHGSPNAARAVAAHIGDGTIHQHGVTTMLLMRAEAAEGHLAEAFERGQRWLADPSADLSQGSTSLLLVRVRVLAILLGRTDEHAQTIRDHLIVPRLLRHDYVRGHAAAACAHASRALGEACFQDLADAISHLERADVMGRDIEAYRRLLRRDYEGAADAARMRVRRPSVWSTRFSDVLAPIFDGAGEPELAERIDRRTLEGRGELNGADLAFVRAARRAAARGDADEAARWARVVVRSWASFEPQPAVVGEMRSLIR